MNRTSIEWVKNPDGSQGYTWNPITGCLNQVNGLCKGGGFPCYAYKLAHGRLKHRYTHGNYIIAPADKGLYEKSLDPFYPRFWPDKLRELDVECMKRCQYRARGIFVCDMSDLFGIGVPEEWTSKVLSAIRKSYHRFYLLTKQPQNLIKFSPFPDNCHVGVTATDSEYARQAMMVFYDLVKAKVKYLSIEPLLESDGRPYWRHLNWDCLDWVIIGALTCKSYWELVAMYPDATDRIMKYGRTWTLQPRIEWVQEIVGAADKAGMPVFLKDNLKPLLNAETRGIQIGNHKEIIITELRQELPAK